MLSKREMIELQLKRVLDLPDDMLVDCHFQVTYRAKELATLQRFCDAIGTKWREIGANIISTETLGPYVQGIATFPPGTLGGVEIVKSSDMSLVNRCES